MTSAALDAQQPWEHEEHLARRGMTSRTVAALPPSGIRRFFEMLDQMTDVISLGVGQPDFATPAQVAQAGVDSMLDGRTGYTSNYGLLELRERLSAHLERRYGVEYSTRKELLLTSGVSEALDIACRAILDPGDEVLVPEPAYVAFAPVITLAGGRYVPVPTGPETAFMVAPEDIESRITPATIASCTSTSTPASQQSRACGTARFSSVGSPRRTP